MLVYSVTETLDIASRL